MRVESRRPTGEGKAGDGVGVENGESLEWLKIDFRGVQLGRLAHPMRTHDKLGAAATPDIGLENPVRVVQIGQDQIELGEVVCQVLRQLPAAREKAGQRPRFDGLDPVYQATRQSQLGDVGITQHFEVGLRKLSAQRGDGRQCQNEIADRAAANDQNPALGRIHGINTSRTAGALRPPT